MLNSKKRPLRAEEQQIFNRLFLCNFPGRDELRRQLVDLKVSQLDENGWISLHPSVKDPAVVKYRVPIEGSYPDVDGVQIHILLHVVDGFLCDLEVFKEDGSAVVQHPEASTLKLFCPTGGEPA